MGDTSEAQLTFIEGIKDAENLLAHFNKLNTKPPPPEIEVLKRTGLVMAMTAWETYVEDRVVEAARARLAAVPDQALVQFMQTRVGDEISRLHNPTAGKTLQLMKDFAGVDVMPAWKWNGVEPEVACRRLDGYLRLRGEVVHRSRTTAKGIPPKPDLVKKEDLEKAIRFLHELVKATDRALSRR